jgi:formate dehydrogenase maturation protein FdhE
MKLFHSHRHNTAKIDTGCPHCGSAGIVQVVDLVQGVDVMQCRGCRNRWEIQRSITERLAAAG